MKSAKIIITVMALCLVAGQVRVMAGQWGAPPAGWSDFKFGLVDGNIDPFKTALKNAVNAAGVQIDYSYVYITSPADVEGFLFAPWFNYAKTRPGTVKPSVTIYMLAGGADALTAILANAANATFMKTYFQAIAEIADSCKGTKPIYVIEPDVWGYLMNRASSYTQISDANLSQVCHINDLGLSWLSGFSNTIADLPGAIIKTLKNVDPNCYCGILGCAWGFTDMTSSSVETADAQNEAAILNKWLREPNRGDFIAVEKNGEDAGAYGAGSIWFWTDTQNANYVAWCKTLAKAVNLPLFGWQISIGYQSENGYPTLANTSGSYQDTYFPYFFRHVSDFINAGFIGYDAGVNGQGAGTYAAMASGSGDNGWFLDRLKTFNASRPYNLNISTSAQAARRDIVIQELKISQRGSLLRVSGVPARATVALYSLLGEKTAVLKPDFSLDVTGIPAGTYVLRVFGPGTRPVGFLINIK
jgi:hypothetical protein